MVMIIASRPHYWLEYETLCLEPWRTSLNILDWLGVKDVNPSLEIRLSIAIRNPSWMSHSTIKNADTMIRLTMWKHKLPPDAQEKILNWVDRLGVTFYNQGIFPVDMRDKAVYEAQT